MLVLSRGVSEYFVIEMPDSDDVIKIMVVDSRDGVAKIGIEADKKFNVYRSELRPLNGPDDRPSSV